MFQPFERGLDDATVGFGLGLAIAQRAVQMHSAKMTARVVRHGVVAAGKLRKAEYEIHTEEGDVYFTRSMAEPSESQTVIYSV